MVEDESQSPKPEISPTPKADQFKAEVKKQIEQRKAIGEPTRYAEEVVMAWDQPMGSAYPNGQWDLVYESVCADQKEYEGDVDKISEVAHRVNQYRIPLDELTTYNTIKFESVKIVGCPQG